MKLFYVFIYWLTKSILLKFKKHFSEKIQNTIELRNTPQIIWKTGKSDSKKEVIWLHAASGEIEYLKPILRRLRTEFPDKRIFVSFFSPSALLWIHKIDCDGWGPLPWDDQNSVNMFLDQLNPKLLVISRTDLWPNLIWACRKRKIPSILFAATFASGSKKMNFWSRRITGELLNSLTTTLVVDQEDLAGLRTLAPKAPALVAGDSRYDQVAYRLSQNKSIPIKNFDSLKDTPIFIAGSTWPEDEQVIIAALRQLIFTSPELRFILVPHEVDLTHLQGLHDMVKDLNLSCEFFTDLVKHEREFTAQVLIVDEYGWLLDLYRFARCAFIGGSFKQQVHSVMEALGSHLPVIVGPHYQNNREAIEFINIQYYDFRLVKSVQNADEMAHYIRKILSLSKSDLQQFRNLVGQEFDGRRGATDKIFKEITQCL